MKANIINAIKQMSYDSVAHQNVGTWLISASASTVSHLRGARNKHFVQQSVVAKDIASYVTAYNKSKLDNLIFEQTLIPSYVLNQDLYQKALNGRARYALSNAATTSLSG